MSKLNLSLRTILYFLLILAFGALFIPLPENRNLDGKIFIQPPNLSQKTSVPKYSNQEIQQQAIVAINATRLGEAENLYKELLVAEPENEEATYGLSVVYALSGRPELAVEALHEVIKLNPEIIKRALEDPKLESLKTNDTFQNLLRIEDINIDEMYPHLRNPPIAPRQ